jgi:hypothetical protein
MSTRKRSASFRNKNVRERCRPNSRQQTSNRAPFDVWRLRTCAISRPSAVRHSVVPADHGRAQLPTLPLRKPESVDARQRRTKEVPRGGFLVHPVRGHSEEAAKLRRCNPRLDRWFWLTCGPLRRRGCLGRGNYPDVRPKPRHVRTRDGQRFRPQWSRQSNRVESLPKMKDVA